MPKKVKNIILIGDQDSMADDIIQALGELGSSPVYLQSNGEQVYACDVPFTLEEAEGLFSKDNFDDVADYEVDVPLDAQEADLE